MAQKLLGVRPLFQKKIEANSGEKFSSMLAAASR
jgi:hypothetical protein